MSRQDGRRERGKTAPLGTPAAVVAPEGQERTRAGTVRMSSSSLPSSSPVPSPTPTPVPAAGERTRAGTVRMSADAIFPHPAPVIVDDERGSDAEDREANLLPPELPAEEREARSRRSTGVGFIGGRTSRTLPLGHARPSLTDASGRASRLSALVGFDQRTSLADLAGRADRITRLTSELLETRRRVRIAAAVVGLSLAALIVALAVSVGQWRYVPLGLLFLLVTAVIAFVAVRSLLPRLARRFGDVQLPGRVGMYVGLFATAISSLGAVVTWGVSEGSVFVGRALLPAAPTIPAPGPPPLQVVVPPPPPVRELPRWDGHVWVRPGKLYMPPSFAPKEGTFDLILHFHGDGDLVHQSVFSTKLNALVHVTNLGTGSGPYESRFAVPGALDDLLKRIAAKSSEKVGEKLEVGRVAITTWSAGYGALSSLLSNEQTFERIDAVLVLDGIHGGFAPEGQRKVHPLAIAPFVKFAEQAAAGNKLMMITHSAIPTSDYCSSTESADAILAAVGAERRDVEGRSPPVVDLPVAIAAFPSRERNWLNVRTEAQKGDFHVLGCSGNGKGDHIAHLAQMSVTVLPELEKRWR